MNIERKVNVMNFNTQRFHFIFELISFLVSLATLFDPLHTMYLFLTFENLITSITRYVCVHTKNDTH